MYPVSQIGIQFNFTPDKCTIDRILDSMLDSILDSIHISIIYIQRFFTSSKHPRVTKASDGLVQRDVTFDPETVKSETQPPLQPEAFCSSIYSKIFQKRRGGHEPRNMDPRQ